MLMRLYLDHLRHKFTCWGGLLDGVNILFKSALTILWLLANSSQIDLCSFDLVYFSRALGAIKKIRLLISDVKNGANNFSMIFNCTLIWLDISFVGIFTTYLKLKSSLNQRLLVWWKLILSDGELNPGLPRDPPRQAGILTTKLSKIYKNCIPLYE